jgi:hypothetical protein
MPLGHGASILLDFRPLAHHLNPTDMPNRHHPTDFIVLTTATSISPSHRTSIRCHLRPPLASPDLEQGDLSLSCERLALVMLCVARKLFDGMY